MTVYREEALGASEQIAHLQRMNATNLKDIAELQAGKPRVDMDDPGDGKSEREKTLDAKRRDAWKKPNRVDARGRGMNPIGTSEANTKRVLARIAANNARNHALPEQTEKPWGDEEPVDSEAERKKMNERKRDAWKKTPPRIDRAKGRGAAR
jgi:hypothetical protein